MTKPPKKEIEEQNKMGEEELSVRTSITNIVERLEKAKAYRKEEMRKSFYAGFLMSGEGFNGEYPFEENKSSIENSDKINEAFEKFYGLNIQDLENEKD